MSVVNESNHRGWDAGADLSAAADTYKTVKFDGNGDIVLGAATSDNIIGILENSPELGDTAEVRLISASGTGKVRAGGNVSVGDMLTQNSTGRAIATTTTGHKVFGRAISAGATDEIIEYAPFNHIVD